MGKAVLFYPFIFRAVLLLVLSVCLFSVPSFAQDNDGVDIEMFNEVDGSNLPSSPLSAQNNDDVTIASPDGNIVESVSRSADGSYEEVSTNQKLDRGNLSFYEWDIPDPHTIPSLFLTPWTQALIREYRGKIDLISSAVDNESDNPRHSSIRELALNGISYKGEDNWTIWLNGQRITPTAIPSQVHELQVTNEYIDIKWYDSYTNIIFPVRLRPHQRFNLDTRIFLPG